MDGKAIAFCDSSERNLLRGIERLIRQPIPVLRGHPFEGAANDAPRKTVEYSGSGIDRAHRPAARPGFRPASSNSRFGSRPAGERPAMARSGGRSRF